jgi:hypothetical protein
MALRQNRVMSSPATGLRVASIFFAIFALAHIIRLIGHIHVTVGAIHVPMWVSVVALIVAGFLCVWLWRLSARG